MKYQVGDIVLILHSNEEGRVVDIINENMMMVDVKGVIFPVYMDQVDFPYYKRFTEKKLFPAKKIKKYVDDVRKEKTDSAPKVADGVWVTFLPVMESDEAGDDIVKELKIYLNNRTTEAYLFIFTLHFFGKPDFELKNQVQPFEDFYLFDIPFGDLNDSPSFDFEFSLLEPDKKKAPYIKKALKLKPKQLFAKIEKLKTNNEATFSYLLFNNFPDKPIEEKPDQLPVSRRAYKVYDATKARQHLEPARSVIDLHIEKLTKDWNRMSNYEILSLQLKTFEKYYHLSVAHHQPALTVIHGIGEGVLKDQIHELLRLKKEVSTFVNQYHPKYGYGATEIYFQY